MAGYRYHSKYSYMHAVDSINMQLSAMVPDITFLVVHNARPAWNTCAKFSDLSGAERQPHMCLMTAVNQQQQQQQQDTTNVKVHICIYRIRPEDSPCFHLGTMMVYEQLPELGQQNVFLTSNPLLKLSCQLGFLSNGASPEEPDALHCLAI